MRRILPACFIGHGSPMNLILENSFTKALNKLGQELPSPKAILVISAHWLTKGTEVTCNEKPKTIYDFYGFPQELYNIEYKCPGAGNITHLFDDIGVKCDNSRGLDHGVWAVLKHMYPEANIPVMEMSLDMTKSARYHYEMGKKLKFIRENGVLIIGSGDIVHNLRMADFENIDAKPYEWAIEFEAKAKECLIHKNIDPLIADGDTVSLSVPTNEHYLPMLYILGMMEENERVRFVHESMQNKSVSMLSFVVD